MKKQYLEWMQELSWERHSLGGGEHCLTLDLDDRTLIYHGKIVSAGLGATFYHGAGVTFPLFQELAKHLHPAFDYNLVRVFNLHRPVFYKSDRASKNFIRECSQKLVTWAQSLTLEEVVKEKCKLELDDGMKVYHGGLVSHLSALILSQNTDVLLSHLEALDKGISPHFNVHQSDAKELLHKAIDMSRNPKWAANLQQGSRKNKRNGNTQKTRINTPRRTPPLLSLFKKK